jgi:hypothetical protein
MFTRDQAIEMGYDAWKEQDDPNINTESFVLGYVDALESLNKIYMYNMDNQPAPKSLKLN